MTRAHRHVQRRCAVTVARHQRVFPLGQRRLDVGQRAVFHGVENHTFRPGAQHETLPRARMRHRHLFQFGVPGDLSFQRLSGKRQWNIGEPLLQRRGNAEQYFFLFNLRGRRIDGEHHRAPIERGGDGQCLRVVLDGRARPLGDIAIRHHHDAIEEKGARRRGNDDGCQRAKQAGTEEHTPTHAALLPSRCLVYE
ncbi:MAG: hypothetical protein BWY76_03097 [bacterium ADurb.Bin429]|nr:MAG: hypothetical protein BWY76_03097 [bacterium ADurb.Bin429]